MPIRMAVARAGSAAVKHENASVATHSHVIRVGKPAPVVAVVHDADSLEVRHRHPLHHSLRTHASTSPLIKKGWAENQGPPVQCRYANWYSRVEAMTRNTLLTRCSAASPA